jgi:threonine/homoserine/homoserine lactone efflux protein
VLSADYLVTATVVALIPGTGVIYTVSHGLFAGRRSSVLAAVGCTLGIVPHLVAATLGLSAIVNTGAHVFEVLKLAGAAYLLYLAWGMWRSTGAVTFAAPAPSSDRRVVVRGTVVNLLNPKLTIFFFAFLPQFTPAGASVSDLAVLGGVFMVVTLVVFVLYGALASALRQRVVTSRAAVRRLQRGSALVFAGLGVRLALQDR